LARDEALVRKTFVENLRFAAKALKAEGMKLLIEPINNFDVPGFWLNRTALAISVLDEVDADNAFVQYDIYHAQRHEGDLANTLSRHIARIAHVQVADNPGRHEPGTGEINFGFLFAHLTRIGYTGTHRLRVHPGRRHGKRPALAGARPPQAAPGPAEPAAPAAPSRRLPRIDDAGVFLPYSFRCGVGHVCLTCIPTARTARHPAGPFPGWMPVKGDSP
jgi:hypothetical protein